MITGTGNGETQFLPPESSAWIDSPVIPSYCFEHQLLEDPFGGLIVIGGDENSKSKFIF